MDGGLLASVAMSALPPPVADTAPDQARSAADWRASAERLRGEGRLLEAIDVLSAANRVERDPEIEHMLVSLRIEAFPSVQGQAGLLSWPPDVVDSFPGPLGVAGVPEVMAHELTGPLLAGGITHHGCVLVRGLIGPGAVDRLVSDIDQAFAAYDCQAATDTPMEPLPPWYVPVRELAGGSVYGFLRDVTRETGALAAAESPRAVFDQLEIFREAGLDRLIIEHLGERPAIAMNKWTLRRVPTDQYRADWHQDGAFLGPEVRALNVWLALSTCGGDSDAAGLDIVPRRLESVAATGTHGAAFDWSVGPELVAELTDENGPVRPLFYPGDALLFDELLLHRGGVSANVHEAEASEDRHMTRERYAIETWFFAPSTYPMDRPPIVY